jgi:hypothetical protein
LKTGSKYHELLEKVLKNFGDEQSAINYVTSIVKKYPRYAKDQLRIISKLQKEYSTDELLKAVEYCQTRNLISSADFRDTLVYFKTKPDFEVKKKIFLPTKYRTVTADVRSLAEYSNLCQGGEIR